MAVSPPRDPCVNTAANCEGADGIDALLGVLKCSSSTVRLELSDADVGRALERIRRLNLDQRAFVLSSALKAALLGAPK